MIDHRNNSRNINDKLPEKRLPAPGNLAVHPTDSNRSNNNSSSIGRPDSKIKSSINTGRITLAAEPALSEVS